MFSPVPFALAMAVFAMYAIAAAVLAVIYKQAKKRLPWFRRIFEPRQPRELQFADRYFIFTLAGGAVVLALSLI